MKQLELQKYLDTATQAAAIIQQKYSPQNSSWQFSLYDGALGCAYALLYLYRACCNDSYKDFALRIFEDSQRIYENFTAKELFGEPLPGSDYRNELSFLLTAIVDRTADTYCFPFVEEIDPLLL